MCGDPIVTLQSSDTKEGTRTLGKRADKEEEEEVKRQEEDGEK